MRGTHLGQLALDHGLELRRDVGVERLLVLARVVLPAGGRGVRELLRAQQVLQPQLGRGFLDAALEFVTETVARGESVLFVGTKKQGQEAIADQATRVGMPYVNQRWLGGMLTNFSTVFKRLQRMKELEVIDFNDVAGSGLTKKELLIGLMMRLRKK